MPKNLIRNGGFERGTTDFWTAVDAKSFAVDTAWYRKGTYCGKITCDGSNHPYLITNDYIPITLGETAYFEAWLKASDTHDCYLVVKYFDEALTQINAETHQAVSIGSAGWTQMLETISGYEGALYCKPYLQYVTTTEDKYFTVDDVIMYKYLPEDVILRSIQMDSRVDRTSAATYTSDWFMVAPFKEATFLLSVATLTGTNDTLNVTIQSKSLFKSEEYVLATFNEVVTGGGSQVLVVTAGIGVQIKVKAVLAGTDLHCTYWLEAVLKR